MSTTARFTTHVPVDEFIIIDGPSARVLRKLHYYPYEGKDRRGTEFDVTFTLTTAASKTSFTRTVRLNFAVSRENNIFNIQGVFCDEIVDIMYDAHRRTGRIH